MALQATLTQGGPEKKKKKKACICLFQDYLKIFHISITFI